MKGIVLSKKMLAVYGIFVVLFSAQFAHAQVQLGTPAYGGTGCPAGLAPQITIKKGVLSVRFNNFLLQAEAANLIDRGNCSIRLPIAVADGYRIALESIDFRGVSRVPAQAQLRFHADANFVGGELIAVDQIVAGPKGTQAVRLTKKATVAKRSACGADTILALSANMSSSKAQGVTGLLGQARVLDAKLVIEACN